MAKKKGSLNIKMQSTESSYFKTTKKNPKNTTEKLSLKMYDPKLRKHVLFKEEKLK